MVSVTTGAAEEYDRQYRVWVERHGPRALDLEWRLSHLLWRHRALLRRYSPEGKRVLDFGCMDGVFTLKLQQLGGEAVGYASLMFAPGSTTIAWHDMTAVRPAFRGRGIATVLKKATIAWAIAHGVETLETGNDEANAPMRAVNLALGYRPQPDYVGLVGPLPPAG